MNIEQQTFIQNHNIMFNIMSCLEFKQRYKLCLTSIKLFNNSFRIFKHPEIIDIEYDKYPLINIWKNIKFEMYISNSNIKDVSMLSNIHVLTLSDCSYVIDVSSLGNIHILNLECCDKITDVSMLGNVYELNLSYCNGITDISMLGNVYHLCLWGCENITDVSMLRNVHTLDLTDCKGITDVSNSWRNTYTYIT